MTQLLLALLLSQAASFDSVKEQKRAAKLLATGKYAEAESVYLAASGFPQAKHLLLMNELPLAVNAAAQQGKCAALREQLDLTNPQHQYLQAVLDAAAGDLTVSRATLTLLLSKAQADGGANGPDLSVLADFLAFLDWAEGDAEAAQRHSQLGLDTAEMSLAPRPFQNAITNALFADKAREQGKKDRALQVFRKAVSGFESAGASGHAFLAFTLEAQAKLLEEVGQKADATAARARAASIRGSRWCR
jgi:hypothetical protein